MGFVPPDTAPGNIVVALGGPAVPFVVRGVSALAFGGLVGDGHNAKLVPDQIGRDLSQLLGPCYLQGIMKAELWEQERYKADFEWDIDGLGMIPKPTLCLI